MGKRYSEGQNIYLVTNIFITVIVPFIALNVRWAQSNVFKLLPFPWQTAPHSKWLKWNDLINAWLIHRLSYCLLMESFTSTWCKADTLYSICHTLEVHTQTLVRSSTEESLVKKGSEKMDESQNCSSGTSPWITHIHIYVHILRYAHSHTHSHASPLHWKCRSVPFLHGALPATHSTLLVCDPDMCWKGKYLTSCHFLLVPSHRVSSYVEHII